jgi:hypothetical protein
MRWIAYLLIVSAAIGCRSQSTPLANPFLAPDRVPPPATRTLAPGTAEPYYPPAAATVVAPAVVPGATTYPPVTTPTYTTPTAPMQTAPVTPPGGWGQPPATTNPYGQPISGYNPVRTNPTDSVAVRINPDDQSLRFDGVPNNNPNDILQVAANQQMSTMSPYVYTPPAAVPTPATVQPAQFVNVSLPGAASDGFRPQGSGQQDVSPSIARPASNQSVGAIQEDPAHFGFDPTYGWLRGQLQFYPESGYWGLRYITVNGSPDPYGGVVVIANPEVLSGVQPGEFLLVQGFLETESNFDGTFLPLYSVEGIQRQR